MNPQAPSNPIGDLFMKGMTGLSGPEMNNIKAGQGIGTAPVNSEDATLKQLEDQINQYYKSGDPGDIGQVGQKNRDYIEWIKDLEERRYNEQQAQLAREWEKMMSDTAFSRRYKDIERMGLNPVMALISGNSLQAAETPNANVNKWSHKSKVAESEVKPVRDTLKALTVLLLLAKVLK